MKNNFYKEIITALVLIILAIVLLNPFDLWMTDAMLMVFLAVTLVVFGIFASFVLREKVSDERDGLHRMLAGRTAFLAGATVLMVGIIVQAHEHAVDIWLVLGLVVMILAKIGAIMWSDRNL